MSKIVKSLLVGALMLPTVALAEAPKISSTVLAAYAAMAKLEANKAEAAGAVMLASIPGLPDDVKKEAAEDYAGDLAQISEYIEVLGDMDLSDEQKSAVKKFAEAWEKTAVEGTRLISQVEDTAEYRQRAFAWWEGLDELDDLIDDALEDLLEENRVSFE